MFDDVGSAGPVRVLSRAKALVPNDGNWATIRCQRVANQFWVVVKPDGVVKALVRSVTVTTGSITNSADTTVGSKVNSDVDTYVGSMDDLKFYKA